MAAAPQPQQPILTSPGVVFSDDQYDSDIDAELDLGPSRETLHEGQILKSGYLMKKGERIKIWKKKWFVLRTSKLAYYKDSKEYELLRIVDIRDVHRAAEVVVKHKLFVFVILTPRRTFTVQAESAEDMEDWIRSINQAKIQYDLTSSSDMDSYSGSASQLELQQQNQATPGRSTPLQRRQLHPQQHPHPLSISDPGLLSSEARTSGQLSAKAISPPASSPISCLDPNLPKVSGLSLGILSQSVGQLPSSIPPVNNPGRILQTQGHTSPTRTDGLSLITTGTQDLRIGSLPSATSPSGLKGQHADFPPNSYSSNYSFNSVPGTPSSPDYTSGGEHQYGMTGAAGEHISSEDDEAIEDDPTQLDEAGRAAAAANAPGSGIVTEEQMGNKVVRQGYLLKLGNAYKTWKKKWFVLRGDNLTYYKNTKEYQPHGIIPLNSIIDCLQTDPVSKSKQYCLRIVTSKRSFVCCAPDEDTLLQWLDALHMETARVKQEESRRDHQDYATDKADLDRKRQEQEDADILSESRAMGRTAHLMPRSGSRPSGLNASYSGSGGASSLVFGSSAQSSNSNSSQMRKVLSLDAALGEATGVNYHDSTGSPSSPSCTSMGPSVTFRTPGPLHFTNGHPTPVATVTFSN
ncbi:hypothetical protein BG003_006454 [Podila horticola]|nr:hypothetical protein BG003_006454 [Podila horticola]